MQAIILVLVLLFCRDISVAAARDYEIHLDRPVKAGASFRVAATGWQSEKSTITVDGELMRDDREKYHLDFEAMVTVLATDHKGRITRETATVIKCDKTEAWDRKPLLPKGAVILASAQEAGVVFQVDGRPAGREVNAALDLLLSLSKGGASDDQIFGTPQRRNVGDTWNINGANAAGGLGEGTPGGGEIGDIAGTSRLEKVISIGETECLQIGSEISIDNVVPELPPGIAVEKSLMQGKFQTKLPTDTARMPVEEATAIIFTLLARGKPVPDGPEMVLESTREYRVSQRTLPVR